MKSVRKALILMLAVTITVGYLLYSNRNVTLKAATMEDVLNEAKAGGYRLISTDELWARYKDRFRTLLLVDTRQEWEYRTGHISGAVNFPMEPTGWSRWRSRGALKKFLGPDKTRFIVFY
ncbi:MAG: rhodanese-like domain-containing protein [Desulfobacterales bacterium]|nr:rhodanese-like domain-containing protein [Desulfobacterales bacterium]